MQHQEMSCEEVEQGPTAPARSLESVEERTDRVKSPAGRHVGMAWQ